LTDRYIYHPLSTPIVKIRILTNHKKTKEKCSSVVVDRSLLSHELFMAVKGPKPNTIVLKVL
jgi:hypothetical protein